MNHPDNINFVQILPELH